MERKTVRQEKAIMVKAKGEVTHEGLRATHETRKEIDVVMTENDACRRLRAIMTATKAVELKQKIYTNNYA